MKLLVLSRKAVLWLLTEWFVLMVTLFLSAQRRRMSHDNGIVAAGRLTVVEQPAFPEHDFFQPGRAFDCRLRHATVSFLDDAMLTVRSASVKFADSDYESPLDLEMNTGAISLFWTAWNFVQFATSRHRKNGTQYRRYYERFPLGKRAAQVGLRRNPETFAQLYYYSQCPFRFVGRDGQMRLVKYRLIPEDRGAETGIPTAEELETPWDQRALSGETRSRNYLKDEFRRRIEAGPVRYHLQLQLHSPHADDSAEIGSCSAEWEVASHPWLDLATIELDRILPHSEGNRMRHNIGQQPESLGLLEAQSIHDYASVNYMRARSGLAKATRLASYRLFGMLKIRDHRKNEWGAH